MKVGRVKDGDDGDARLADVARWRESAVFSAAERTALEYAEVVTRTGERVSDVLFARLQRHFDEGQIVELTAAIALENFRSKLNPALGVEAQGFCPLPKR